MQIMTSILPLVDIALLLLLGAAIARLVPGAPTWRERLSWLVLLTGIFGAAVL